MSKHFLAAAICALAAGASQAAVLDLGVSNANLFSLGNFKAANSDVEGAVLVRGNLTASSYSINEKNQDAYGKNNGSGYSLAIGGNLDYSSGSIKHGQIYVGGSTKTSSVGLESSTVTKTAPVSFDALASNAKNVSSSLSKVAATGSSTIQYGGMTLTGSKKSVEVFNLSGKDLASVNNFKFNGLSSGTTLIFNISGADAIGFNQNGVGLAGFKDYNVLFNFYQSTALNIQSVGIQGSLLAPLATVTGYGSQINGNVIVGDWLSNVQVNSNHFFKPVYLNGYATAVPEPETYAMLLAGLGLLGVMRRRRRG